MVSFFLRKSCHLWENVEKYCRVGQATDGNMVHMQCMLDTWGYKYTHSGCVIVIAFQSNDGCMNAPQCYVIRTLPVLYILEQDCIDVLTGISADEHSIGFSLIIWGHFLTRINNEMLSIYIMVYIKLGFKEVIGQLEENFA